MVLVSPNYRNRHFSWRRQGLSGNFDLEIEWIDFYKFNKSAQFPNRCHWGPGGAIKRVFFVIEGNNYQVKRDRFR